jgi:hypothetical protein
MAVTQLGYLGIGLSDIGALDYATNVFGAQLCGSSSGPGQDIERRPVRASVGSAR